MTVPNSAPARSGFSMSTVTGTRNGNGPAAAHSVSSRAMRVRADQLDEPRHHGQERRERQPDLCDVAGRVRDVNQLVVLTGQQEDRSQHDPCDLPAPACATS